MKKENTMKTLIIISIALASAMSYADQPKDKSLKNCVEFKEQWVCEKHTKGRKLHKSPARKIHKEVVVLDK
jgi:hypothetical protein